MLRCIKIVFKYSVRVAGVFHRGAIISLIRLNIHDRFMPHPLNPIIHAFSTALACIESPVVLCHLLIEIVMERIKILMNSTADPVHRRKLLLLLGKQRIPHRLIAHRFHLGFLLLILQDLYPVLLDLFDQLIAFFQTVDIFYENRKISCIVADHIGDIGNAPGCTGSHDTRIDCRFSKRLF